MFCRDRFLTFGWGGVVASKLAESNLQSMTGYNFSSMLILFQEYEFNFMKVITAKVIL